MKTLLHVGCGPANITNLPSYFRNGDWLELRYDIDESTNPDIVGELQDMSIIADNSVDAVYSSHNIEHVSSFEVNTVFMEFLRVLKHDGIAVVNCPDILSVAQAITQGSLTDPLYISPAGPISAIDIIYGHQHAIKNGNHFMAHKTAFDSHTLSKAFLKSGFSGSIIGRSKIFSLHALATKKYLNKNTIHQLFNTLSPEQDFFIQTDFFGSYASPSP